MKAHKQEQPFSPVILTLETQDEVDAIFAFLNHSISDRVGFDDQFETLKPFASEKAHELWKLLS